jgi:pyruvate dehydrogenase E2 component (dihydrolipoamide acetyltransferase)
MVGFFSGAAEKRVIPGAEGQFEVGSFMSATLSCDHRVIDGSSLFLSTINH